MLYIIHVFSDKVASTDEPNSGKFDHVLAIMISNLFFVLFLFLACPGYMITETEESVQWWQLCASDQLVACLLLSKHWAKWCYLTKRYCDFVSPRINKE